MYGYNNASRPYPGSYQAAPRPYSSPYQPSAQPNPGSNAAVNLFNGPVSTEAPLEFFQRQSTHPVSRAAVIDDLNTPVQTNRFYANLFLGNQTQGVWTLPYMIYVTKAPEFWGLSISHTDPNQLATGPDPTKDPVQYVISPLGIRSFTFSAAEFSPSSSVTVDSTAPHSANVNLLVNENQRMTVNLVQGMGFVTARYYSLTPVLSSGVFFRAVEPVDTPRGGLQKFRLTLEDGKIWLLYICPAAGSSWLALSPSGNGTLIGNSSFTGFIQIAKLSDPGQEGMVDAAAGAFPVTTKLSASVSGNTGTYSFNHSRFGVNNAGALLMYALPHHVSSFDAFTGGKKVNLFLNTPTKGVMQGVLADNWTLVETGLPTDITWLPPNGANITSVVVDQVRAAAIAEAQQDMDAQSDLDSMYFSGKALAKFAQIVLALAVVVKDQDQARAALAKLQKAMSRFATNSQKNALVYDQTWKGIVSSAMYKTGDLNQDFGNGAYNDHHFHYAYFIGAAAIITYVEKILDNKDTWLKANKVWVNQLVRDVANPSVDDKYFPVFRSFDWWNGHSWAKGLFESADGKDQESTSEDVNFAYSMKLWGLVSGDTAMQARGDLMLGIMKRSLNAYFLLTNDNKNHPANFIKNKVTGILFENKVDHATYFGLNPEYIQGIHMLPLLPISPYIRSPQFCSEEWQQWFSNGRADSINDGWKGVLYANVALFDPRTSWNFFTQPEFQNNWLDGGASRTHYLLLAGGLGGAS